ncbi:hypothetical protein MJO28_013604 [Puccinia striiformis f. sp. tritici]|uniref:Post-SET domain-containing protein n=4 Tax=Puccinia striiformis TaxID=27350 RepID=A0A0L0VWF7_9BASI|nr:hypothetical protein Pst134EA_025873 [Puccinia striiformis f. sp. tritici]KAI9615134.1 hypothetical protein H4Q26_011674 [Puccinia striiformis f. sp. tritici PST-130]KNF03606.1 hypothetical protein PSTG_03129 [Puccinia striiformis f. sp. tritici PST-78]POW14496.1 hypothetical protein PSTT_02949 [Puccinia striiformis]KAH9444057.1 hypothetical protein Pst134EB_026444 [Puccinia striiformis f. sp. tritici]KAH9451935.1 hypothetical protein Pst134EA_025873 [Puccinia striiformis f. sp. tritici]
MKIELEKLFFPTRFEVIHGPEGSFESKLISLQDFPAGEVLATLGLECQVSGTKAYTSVQFDDDAVVPDKAHFELNSELVYINHSCEPNVAFELPGGWKGLEEGRWILRSLSAINKGDVLTFAYFSTEWHMAQPFQCACGSKSCLGMIRGAQHLPKQTLDKYFINEHIQRMKQSAE